jgi:hypothetical protein
MALSSKPEVEPILPRSRRVAIQLVGPAIHLLLAAGLHALFPHPTHKWLARLVEFNVVWGLIGLLPIWPFPGGRILAFLLGADRALTMLVTVGLAEVATAVAVGVFRSPALGVVFLLAAVLSALRWRRSWRRQLDSHACAEIGRARALLDARQDDAARLVATAVAQSDCCSEARNAALTVLARAALRAGQPKRAQEALEAIGRRSAVDLETLVAVEIANGQTERAVAALEQARRDGGLDRVAARLLVDLYASVEDYEQVAAVALDLSRVFGAEDVRVIALALLAAGEAGLAGQVAACAGATRIYSDPATDAGSKQRVPYSS